MAIQKKLEGKDQRNGLQKKIQKPNVLLKTILVSYELVVT